ncbi:hypothetical protein PQR33_29110 [Paraburkholderia sediminicola]|uniref:hypothetical protein n=1 Tax=Paraburkholderia sediminicola TaxID=458836 RepID=UPI0038B8D47C
MIEENRSRAKGVAIGKIAFPYALHQGTFYLHFRFISRCLADAAQSSAQRSVPRREKPAVPGFCASSHLPPAHRSVRESRYVNCVVIVSHPSYQAPLLQ